MADEDEKPQPLPLRFYQTSSGGDVVRDWIRDQSDEDRRAVGLALYKIQLGWPIGMPLVRSLGGGLHEARINLKNRIARVIFAVLDGEMVALHGFIKKTQKTPADDLDLARKRKVEYEA